MSTIITPTVGRKVWYRPSVAELAGRCYPMKVIDGQPLDATVIAVHDDRLVNLLVIDAEGNGFPRLNVQLVQEDDVYETDGARAEWMPYQTAQAAKAAATEEGAAA